MGTLEMIHEQEILGRTFRVYGTKEEPLMLAKDVAEWIEYDVEQVGKMLKTVDEDEKVRINTRNIITGKGNPLKWFLTEDGLYEVLMQSRKPIAKLFKKEVKKILKEIRTKGAYLTDGMVEEILTNPDTIIKLAQQVKDERAKSTALQNKNEELQETIQVQAPKVEYTENVLASEGTLTMRDIAKDFGLSAMAVNKILNEQGIIFKQGGLWNVYSKYQDLGLTKMHTYAPDSNNISRTSIKWTHKGYKFIVDTLRELGYEVSTVREF